MSQWVFVDSTIPAADYQLIKWIDVFALLTNWSAQWNNRVMIIVQRLVTQSWRSQTSATGHGGELVVVGRFVYSADSV